MVIRLTATNRCYDLVMHSLRQYLVGWLAALGMLLPGTAVGAPGCCDSSTTTSCGTCACVCQSDAANCSPCCETADSQSTHAARHSTTSLAILQCVCVSQAPPASTTMVLWRHSDTTRTPAIATTQTWPSPWLIDEPMAQAMQHARLDWRLRPTDRSLLSLQCMLTT